ncbi:MAG: hypothetical protein V7K97_17375 [Nostoc sp.]|uniref:hypothetical protein n=1 Tax=Nostoc sp. TaxID=1180 RepID=UPI002FF7AB26
MERRIQTNSDRTQPQKQNPTARDVLQGENWEKLFGLLLNHNSPQHELQGI